MRTEKTCDDAPDFDVVRLSLRDAPELLRAIQQSQALHKPWSYPPNTLKVLEEYLNAPACIN